MDNRDGNEMMVMGDERTERDVRPLFANRTCV